MDELELDGPANPSSSAEKKKKKKKTSSRRSLLGSESYAVQHLKDIPAGTMLEALVAACDCCSSDVPCACLAEPSSPQELGASCASTDSAASSETATGWAPSGSRRVWTCGACDCRDCSPPISPVESWREEASRLSPFRLGSTLSRRTLSPVAERSCPCCVCCERAPAFGLGAAAVLLPELPPPPRRT